REQKLQQQRKSCAVGSSLTHQITRILACQVCQRLARKWPIGNRGIVAAQPRFADFLCKTVIRIDRRKIACAPRPRVEIWLHQKWIDSFHLECEPECPPGIRSVSRQRGCLQRDFRPPPRVEVQESSYHRLVRNFRIRSRPRSSSFSEVA